MQVKVVQFYLSEDSPHLKQIYDYLHDQKVMGATMFRGVKGFGSSGKQREARLLDIHFDLPIVIEFIEEPAKADEILNHFSTLVEGNRILSFLAEMGVS